MPQQGASPPTPVRSVGAVAEGGTRARVGLAGEAAAVVELERRGMRVLARDWRCRLGQIDVVAEDGQTLVIVEVKARRGSGFGLPQEAVDARKRRKLRALAEAYRLRTGRTTQPIRIDVVGLLLDGGCLVRRLDYIEGAVDGS